MREIGGAADAREASAKVLLRREVPFDGVDEGRVAQDEVERGVGAEIRRVEQGVGVGEVGGGRKRCFAGGNGGGVDVDAEELGGVAEPCVGGAEEVAGAAGGVEDLDRFRRGVGQSVVEEEVDEGRGGVIGAGRFPVDNRSDSTGVGVGRGWWRCDAGRSFAQLSARPGPEISVSSIVWKTVGLSCEPTPRGRSMAQSLASVFEPSVS